MKAHKLIRQAQAKLERSRANIFKTRGGRPSEIHGPQGYVRGQKLQVINSSRVDPEDYADYE